MEVPGLVDLQVNGYLGVDFSSIELTERDFAATCRGLIAGGTTAFLPTIITSPDEVYEHNLPIMAKVVGMEEFSGRLLGLHVEGPFICAEDGARGAHNCEWTREPDPAYLERLLELADGKVRLLTMAAEPDGAAGLCEYAVGLGIAVALGHQMADEGDLERLADAGATACTHVGNGVPAMVARHRNPIWAALANDRLAATIITDGSHLPPAVIKTIIRAKGPERCIVISDASSLAGLPPGRYETLGHKVILDETGMLYDPETGYLCGSSATMPHCMNHLASLSLVSVDQLIAMAFDNPLRLIGLGRGDVATDGRVVFDETRGVFQFD